MAGRVLDETAALAQGAIGQETVGAGGITFALRTVPIVTEIAEVVAQRAPDATFVNFTNPVGLVTEAVRRVLGDRVVGICDAPPGPVQAGRRRPRPAGRGPVVRLLRDQPPRLAAGGADRRPRPAARPARRRRPASSRSRKAGCSGRSGSAPVGMVPNEYLYYYYFSVEALNAMLSGHVRARLSRASSRPPSTPGTARPPRRSATGSGPTPIARPATWRRHGRGREQEMDGIVAAREPGDYGRLALDLVDAMGGPGHRVMILDVPNRSSLPFLDAGGGRRGPVRRRPRRHRARRHRRGAHRDAGPHPRGPGGGAGGDRCGAVRLDGRRRSGRWRCTRWSHPSTSPPGSSTASSPASRHSRRGSVSAEVVSMRACRAPVAARGSRASGGADGTHVSPGVARRAVRPPAGEQEGDRMA